MHNLSAPIALLAPFSHWEAIIAGLKEGIHSADFWQGSGSELTIADIRAARIFAQQTPVGKKGKLIILHGADGWRSEVANALLKLIEEPPAYLQVVLLTESADLLPTIRSRISLQAYGTRPEVAMALRPWNEVIEGYNLIAPGERATVQKLLYQLPLVHGGIKAEHILQSYRK